MAEKPPSSVRDLLGRPLRSLRVSVTDRCNLRCLYCMPEEDYVWLPREELLTFEELTEVVECFTQAGVTRVRLTGGEPLLRKELDRLVAMLAANPRITDLALTTNGVLLEEHADALKRAGRLRVTISLDTLRPERFAAMTRRNDHHRVLAGIAAVRRLGFAETKLDAVIIRDVNDDELHDLIEFGREHQAEVRFIEYMDVPGATRWTTPKVFSRDDMLRRMERRYGPIAGIDEDTSAPASRFMLADGTVFGIIASTTAPFCRNCDRSRITADGMWYRCLYATAGTDLRHILRAGAATADGASRAATAQRIVELINEGWHARDDRGAEQRKSEHLRGAFVPREDLIRDPHLEMHTRGG